MRRYYRSMIRALVRNELVWNILNRTIVRLAESLSFYREDYLAPPPSTFIQDTLATIFPDLKVRHGSFKGMQYPAAASVGSTLFPKLLGSYESELVDVIEQIINKPYTHIVDIGCAEGYYAVGLAMRLQDATVYAFDTDPEAREVCIAMGAANQVGDRLVVDGLCDQARLRSLPLDRALIVCDCEGYEQELFTEALADALAGHDLLIETHDFKDMEISGRLKALFSETHDVSIVRSLDDILKAQYYEYKELEGYSLDEKRELLAEGRPCTMEWLYLVSRSAR